MIRSTFAGYTTAYSALLASQKGLEVTGQNIANVNTDGYTRQRLDLYSRNSDGYYPLYAQTIWGNVGYGVGIGRITQMRDKTLDVRFRDQACDVGESQAMSGALDDLAAIFDKITNTGLEDGFQDFIDKLNELSKNPENKNYDSFARSSAETLTTVMGTYAQKLSGVVGDQKYMLKDVSIPDINGLLTNIAALNKNIKSNQLVGNTAPELLDQRNALLDKLSQYLPIDVSYTPQTLATGTVVENVEVRLKNPGGTPDYITLVNNDSATQLKYSEDADGNAQISMTDPNGGADTDITGSIQSGSVKGLLTIINDTASGVGYYATSFDSLVSQFANAFNEANRVANPAYSQFLADGVTPNPDYVAGSDQYIERPLFVNKNDPTNPNAPITAATIGIAPGWMDGTYGITLTNDPAPGVTDGSEGEQSNVNAMIALFSKKFTFAPGKEGTFSEYFQQIGNEIDSALNAKQTLLNNSTVVMNSISDLRDGLSSVSLDEEGINLLRYQKSYNAAARLMTILDEAVDTIINRMGIIGR